MAELNAELEAADEKAGEALIKSREAKETAETAREEADEVLSEEGRIRGLNIATRRILGRIPGLREAQRLVYQIRMLLRVSPEVAAQLS